MKRIICFACWSHLCLFATIHSLRAADAPALEWIVVDPDKQEFVRSGTQEKFVVWGVNYDHDESGAMLEDYWTEDWDTVVEDFAEIKALGCNVVRIHLQVGRMMKSAESADEANLKQLSRLLKLAEKTGLYLDLTGLGCYHKQDVPDWYDLLSESDRWDVQCRFWRAVAIVGNQSPAVFCYDLMNEPILPGETAESEWLTGELGGKYFVQRISLDRKGRVPKEIAKAWIARLSAAIREVDERHLITVGVIPWALTFKGARPLFYDLEVGQPLDFVSVHFYPKKGEIESAVNALKMYDIGKPLVIEEMFPLACDVEEMASFLEGSRTVADGWISFYWGKTIAEYEADHDLRGAVMAAWLRFYREKSPRN